VTNKRTYIKSSEVRTQLIAMSSLLVLTAASQNYSGKVLKILETFLSRPRPRPRLFSQDQDQDSGSQDQDQDFISVLETPRDQDLGLEDYITGKLPSDTLMLSGSLLESLLLQYLIFSIGETFNLSLVMSVGRISRRWTGGLAEFFFIAGGRRLSKIHSG